MPSFKNLGEFASTTKVSTRFLTWLCYHKEVSEVDHYHRFKIPKRNGQLREISSPKPYLSLFFLVDAEMDKKKYS